MVNSATGREPRLLLWSTPWRTKSTSTVLLTVTTPSLSADKLAATKIGLPFVMSLSHSVIIGMPGKSPCENLYLQGPSDSTIDGIASVLKRVPRFWGLEGLDQVALGCIFVKVLLRLLDLASETHKSSVADVARPIITTQNGAYKNRL